MFDGTHLRWIDHSHHNDDGPDRTTSAIHTSATSGLFEQKHFHIMISTKDIQELMDWHVFMKSVAIEHAFVKLISFVSPFWCRNIDVLERHSIQGVGE